MTYEDAIKKIKQFGLYHAIGDLPNSVFTVQAFELAIEALEKQIPKKPLVHEYIIGIVKDTCPACGKKSIEDGYLIGDFCPYCGQAIDWEKEKR